MVTGQSSIEIPPPRHKGTYYTNEAKGTEFAESADAALQSDPALQDAGDTSKKEYFI